MKFQNTEVWGFEHAIRGMRNAKQSWDRSDSWQPDNAGYYVIGTNDMKLAQTLIKSGPEHRKFLRQIFVSVDITGSLMFFKQFDTYKIGTVANSESTMHRIHSNPITMDCFETDDMCADDVIYIKQPYNYDETIKDWAQGIIEGLEVLRQKYLETKDKRYWKELIRWLPESWLQKRTITMNYENILCMCSKGQRRFHKLNEWSGQDKPEVENFISWARTLPYAKEFIFFDEEGDNNES